jgi:HSP20 family protein
MLLERLAERERPEGMGEIFEILVTSFSARGGGLPLEGDLSWRPATDAYETEDTFVVQMDLAGMDPASIEVSTDGETLVVRGIRQDIAPPGKKHYSKMEISVGPFERRIVIPIEVDPQSALARYRNGFLYVTLKKGRRRLFTRRRVDVDE